MKDVRSKGVWSAFSLIFHLVIPLVYEVYRGYIVFAFSMCLCVCNHFFSSKNSQQLLDLGF